MMRPGETTVQSAPETTPAPGPAIPPREPGPEARVQLVALIRERITNLQALLGRDTTALDLEHDADDHGLLGQVAERLLAQLQHPEERSRRLIGERIVAGLAPNVRDPRFFRTELGVLLAQAGAGIDQAGVVSLRDAAASLGVDTRTVAGMIADGRLHTLGDGVAAASVHALAARTAHSGAQPGHRSEIEPYHPAGRPGTESITDGEPHPVFGEYGRLADTGELVQCHACGGWFSTLPSHLRVHRLSSAAYRERYGLSPDTPLAARTVRERLSAKGRRAPAHELVSPVFRARVEECAAFCDSHQGRLPGRGTLAEPAERALGEWLRSVTLLIQRRPAEKAYLDEGRIALLDERLPGWRSLTTALAVTTAHPQWAGELRAGAGNPPADAQNAASGMGAPIA
ncbi:MucR family transcriptional regulator [Leucobacter massiliensis]|uniref:Uncharacterized protein n=1 Tax=Leucobacter massiliensis TaxID=1686285 RepID=A0A2S9QPR8_9MICO|nr:MucR family transcriptional regulator [Leucobacter massiliensis]PRI11591.1 hypothetical protein B4915_05600 [Leucobacter massiliensis]